MSLDANMYSTQACAKGDWYLHAQYEVCGKAHAPRTEASRIQSQDQINC